MDLGVALAYTGQYLDFGIPWCLNWDLGGFTLFEMGILDFQDPPSRTLQFGDVAVNP